MPKGRPRGHPPVEYSPIVERDFDLPNGENVAVWVVINVEHDVYDRPVTTHLTPRTLEHRPDVFNFGWRDYGKRVGFWRLRDTLERHGVRATVALNANICDHEPEIVEAGVDRDWEFMAHGETNSQRLAGLGETEERSLIRRARETIGAATGTPPRGWLGPGLTETFNTIDLLADEGFDYVADWCNDEQPYPMDTDAGDLLSLPYTLEMNDVPMFLNYNLTPTEYERAVKGQFDVLYEEGSRPGNAKVMAIALHDYLSGHPHRSKHLDAVLDYITDHDDVWMTTGGAIADHYVEQYG